MAQKRTLKRQLNLMQVVMLGTAGTLGRAKIKTNKKEFHLYSLF